MPWWWPFGGVPEIKAAELHRLLNRQRDIQVVDVRTRVEWRLAHIQGARSVPIHTFKSRLPALELDPSRPVVVICQTAHRSVPAVRLLRGHGYEAHQLAGGMNAWLAARLPVKARGQGQ